MFHQLMVGTLVICLTVLVEGLFMLAATKALHFLRDWLDTGYKHLKNALAIALVTLWLLAAHGVAVWMWAVTFLVQESFTALEPALYFSLVSFTTLGFGDIILPVETRLLSGLAAANGLIAFGLSTAFLVELLMRLRKTHLAGKGEEDLIL